MSKQSIVIRKQCSTCKSDAVRLDAFVVWNAATQSYEIDNVFGSGSWCDTCDGVCTVEDVEAQKQPYHVTINTPMSYGSSFVTLEAALTYAVREVEKVKSADSVPELDGVTCEHDGTGQLWSLEPNENNQLQWVQA